MKKILIGLLLIFAILLSANDEITKTVKAHDFKLENLKGEKIKLSEVYKDKLVILGFWANWCAPCKKELPELDKLQKKYKDSIQVIAVDIDKARHTSKAKAYIKSKKYTFETLFDTDNKVMKLYNVPSPPNTFIISTNGKIIWSHLGYKRGDEKEIESQIIKWIESEKENIKKQKEGELKDTLKAEEQEENQIDEKIEKPKNDCEIEKKLEEKNKVKATKLNGTVKSEKEEIE